jgi:hypothetical protein|tara:strand:+ start:5022 stop:5219 length:198 start_codon:yes stop_codon:yes gene_type:complete
MRGFCFAEHKIEMLQTFQLSFYSDFFYLPKASNTKASLRIKNNIELKKIMSNTPKVTFVFSVFLI